jgi:hypothetical protein
MSIIPGTVAEREQRVLAYEQRLSEYLNNGATNGQVEREVVRWLRMEMGLPALDLKGEEVPLDRTAEISGMVEESNWGKNDFEGHTVHVTLSPEQQRLSPEQQQEKDIEEYLHKRNQVYQGNTAERPPQTPLGDHLRDLSAISPMTIFGLQPGKEHYYLILFDPRFVSTKMVKDVTSRLEHAGVRSTWIAAAGGSLSARKIEEIPFGGPQAQTTDLSSYGTYKTTGDPVEDAVGMHMLVVRRRLAECDPQKPYGGFLDYIRDTLRILVRRTFEAERKGGAGK